MPVAMPVAVRRSRDARLPLPFRSVPIAVVRRCCASSVAKRRTGDVFEHAAEPQAHFGGTPSACRASLPLKITSSIALATQALGALLAHHPGDGVGDVALAAAVRTDDRGHALVEGELRSIGERLEAVDLQTFEAHGTRPRHAVSAGAARNGRDGLRSIVLAGRQNRQRTAFAALRFPRLGKRPRARETVVSVTTATYWGQGESSANSLWSALLISGCSPQPSRADPRSD